MEAAIPCTSASAANPASIPAEEFIFDDPVLLDLAKQRMAAKRTLMGQVLDFFILLIAVMIALAHRYWDVPLVFLLLYWVIRLLVRLVKFYRPDFKNGIRAYLQKRRQLKLEFEYKRLKTMGTPNAADGEAHPR